MNDTTKKTFARFPDHPSLNELDNGGFGDDGDRKFVTALARGFEVIRAFEKNPGALGNSELSIITGIPKATISRLTYTLIQLGYLRQTAADGKYELSPSILALSHPLLANLKVRHSAHAPMQQLANRSGVSVALAAKSRYTMIYIDACTPTDAPSRRFDIGSRVSMAHTAIGRAFLARSSEAERENYFEHFKTYYGSEWPSLEGRIEAAKAEVDARGFCLSDREWGRDIRVIGVPLTDSDGRSVMALNCSAPAFHVTAEQMTAEIGPRLVHLSQDLTNFL